MQKERHWQREGRGRHRPRWTERDKNRDGSKRDVERGRGKKRRERRGSWDRGRLRRTKGERERYRGRKTHPHRERVAKRERGWRKGETDTPRETKQAMDTHTEERERERKMENESAQRTDGERMSMTETVCVRAGEQKVDRAGGEGQHQEQIGSERA